jgi:hypothetical protein
MPRQKRDMPMAMPTGIAVKHPRKKAAKEKMPASGKARKNSDKAARALSFSRHE